MANILIVTEPGDFHAAVVKLALEECGHTVTRWFPADFPTKQNNSVSIDLNGTKWRCRGPGITIEPGNFDTVWLRRPRSPVHPEYHPADRAIAERENQHFYLGLMESAANTARWVNPYRGRTLANNKFLQLREAVAVGLQIPPTLFTNDAAEALRFVQLHGSAIFKTLIPMSWQEDGGLKLANTAVVTPTDLHDTEVVRNSCGVYQKKIAKRFEVRATFFGTNCLSIKIFSQQHHRGDVDWRVIPGSELPVQAHELPAVVVQKCLALMRRLQISFGCFDFIVTPDNEYVFLEVNEQGQFLWVEQRCPEVPMLAAMVHFLSGRSSDANLRFAHEKRSVRADKLVRYDLSLHVRPAL